MSGYEVIKSLELVSIQPNGGRFHAFEHLFEDTCILGIVPKSHAALHGFCDALHYG